MIKLSEIREACEKLPSGDLDIEQLRAFLSVARAALPALIEAVEMMRGSEFCGPDMDRALRSAGIEVDS